MAPATRTCSGDRKSLPQTPDAIWHQVPITISNTAEGGVKDTISLREYRLLVTIRLVIDEALAEKRSRK